MDKLIQAVNGSRFFWGMSMIMVNMGSRYIIGDLTKFHEVILTNEYVKIVILFCMFFMGSRDIVVALCLTFAFTIVIQTWLNEKSKYNLLPRNIKEKFSSQITKKEYEDALKVIENFKAQNKIM